MKNNFPWVFLIAFVVNIGHGAPIKDVNPGQESEVISNILVRRFYGPWNNIQKVNGDYANYGDYETHVQDYQPSSEDVIADEPNVDQSPAADFPSNYGLDGVQTDTGYDPNHPGPASLDTGDTDDAQQDSHETSGNVSQYSQPDETSNGDEVESHESEEYNHEEAEGNVNWTPI